MAAAGEEVIEEIKIAMFWRRHIGEMEYADYDPDDLRRWWKALELRGPEEIRAYVTERTGRHTMSHLLGVTAAPHPPLPIVELWLAAHETRVRTSPVWVSLFIFTLVVGVMASTLNTCATIPDPNKWAINPPPINTPIQAAQNGQAPRAASTPPAQLTPPAAQASSAAQSAQQQQQQQQR